MRTGVKPTVTVEPAISVHIAVDPIKDDDGCLVGDDGTILAFLEWQRAAQVYPRRGTGSSGPGFYSGYFNPSDEQALREYFGQ